MAEKRAYTAEAMLKKSGGLIDNLKAELSERADQLEDVKKRNALLEDECNKLRESQEARENSSQKSKSEDRSMRSENEKMRDEIKRHKTLIERLKEEKIELELTANSNQKKYNDLRDK